MATVTVGMGLTVNTGNFNNFKPDVSITVDTDKDVDKQIQDAVEATRKVTAAVSEEMGIILDEEGMKEYESSMAGLKKSLGEVTQRLTALESDSKHVDSVTYKLEELGTRLEGVESSVAFTDAIATKLV